MFIPARAISAPSLGIFLWWGECEVSKTMIPFYAPMNKDGSPDSFNAGEVECDAIDPEYLVAILEALGEPGL